MKRFPSCYMVYALLMGILVLIKLSIDYAFESQFRSVAQTKVFAWPSLGIFALLGVIGVWCARRTGFPRMLDESVSNKQRFIYPILLGIAFGALSIAVDWNSGWAREAASRMKLDSIHIPFPASALIYPGGAIIVELIYRLIPIPLLVWFFSNVLFRGRWQVQTFWVVAILLAALEPVTQPFTWEGHQVVAYWIMAQDYAANLTQNYLFRRYGFLAPLTLRIAFYLVWHVLWGLAEHSWVQ